MVDIQKQTQTPEQEIEEAFAVGYESGFYDCHRGGVKKRSLRFRQYKSDIPAPDLASEDAGSDLW